MTPAELVVQALRSGRFTQGKGYLSRNGNYCCLGVACEVAIENGVEVPRRQTGGAVFYGREQQLAALPVSVREWLGFTTATGGYDAGRRALTEDNDNLHHSFDRIADTIESRPPGLFT